MLLQPPNQQKRLRNIFSQSFYIFNVLKENFAASWMKLTNVMQTLICKACKQKLESKLICANTKEANVPTHSDNSCMKSSGGHMENMRRRQIRCVKAPTYREWRSQKVIAIPFCLEQQQLYPHLISPPISPLSYKITLTPPALSPSIVFLVN